MCLDPASAALLAASTAASTVGGAIQQRNNNKYADRVATARNETLRLSREKQKQFAANNDVTLQDTFAKFAQPAQTQQLSDAQNVRSAAVDANTTQPAADVPLSGSTPDVIKGVVAERLLEAFNASTAKAKNMAKLSGYNDTMFGNNLNVTGAGRNIETQNNFSRGTAALLPYEQDFAEAQVKRPNNLLPMLLQTAGQFGAGAAGRGMASGWLTPSQPAVIPADYPRFGGLA